MIYMLLYINLLCNTTPIHCTPLRLHPPLELRLGSARVPEGLLKRSSAWMKTQGWREYPWMNTARAPEEKLPQGLPKMNTQVPYGSFYPLHVSATHS